MKEDRSTKHTPAQQETIMHRRQYSAPTLRLYGSVSQLTKSGTKASDENGMGTMATSDRRLKENIVRVGTHPMGFGLYLFDYKDTGNAEDTAPRHFGVMADEVETVQPKAVLRRPDGYMMVDYAMIGITLTDQ